MERKSSSRYSLTSDIWRSDITGKEGSVIVGWSLGLPDQAHKLILTDSAEKLLNEKVFFLPYERHIPSDKLIADLKFSKEIGIIPVYVNKLPSSEIVEVFASALIKLPILSERSIEMQIDTYKIFKHSLSRLLNSSKENMKSILNDIIFESKELIGAYKSNKSFQVNIYILQFPSGFEKEYHYCIVISDDNS